ncbi:MAG: hypothetical protein HYZ91_00545 [Candidatus Omnitrophica bacterium]|nr:hypothetical protein [Candidatus Omnitrophota bacterium]
MTGYPEWLNGWLDRAYEALKMYEPIAVAHHRPDYGNIAFPIQLPEQIVLLESGELILLPETKARLSFRVDELRAIDPTRFPGYLWQEVRKQTSDEKGREGSKEA